jgi:hypothetical protein
LAQAAWVAVHLPGEAAQAARQKLNLVAYLKLPPLVVAEAEVTHQVPHSLLVAQEGLAAADQYFLQPEDLPLGITPMPAVAEAAVPVTITLPVVVAARLLPGRTAFRLLPQPPEMAVRASI